VGDRVRTGQGKVGIVAEIRDDGRVVVEIGAIRLVVAPELLERVEGPTGRPPFRPSAP
jgi:preprotein translocase subunit YajC